MAREELDIQYNLVDNYSNQLDRLIAKTKEFTAQVKQAQSISRQGLSLSGNFAGSVGGGKGGAGGAGGAGGSSNKGANLNTLIIGAGAVSAALFAFNRSVRASDASLGLSATRIGGSFTGINTSASRVSSTLSGSFLSAIGNVRSSFNVLTTGTRNASIALTSSLKGLGPRIINAIKETGPIGMFRGPTPNTSTPPPWPFGIPGMTRPRTFTPNIIPNLQPRLFDVPRTRKIPQGPTEGWVDDQGKFHTGTMPATSRIQKGSSSQKASYGQGILPLGAASMGFPLDPSSGSGGLFGTGQTGLRGLFAALRGMFSGGAGGGVGTLGAVSGGGGAAATFMSVLGPIATAFTAILSIIAAGAGLVSVGFKMVTGVLSIFGTGIKTALDAILPIISAFGQKLLGLISEGVQTFSRFEDLELTLDGLGMGAKGAAEAMKYIQKFALDSALTYEQIAGIVPQLFANQIDWKSALKHLSNIASAVGGSDKGGKFQELALVLMRARGGGQWGEVFPQLGQAGLTKAEFKKSGLNFDKQGSPMFKSNDPEGQWAEFWPKFEVTAQRVAGNIASKMKNSFSVAISNLGDAWSQLWGKVGAGLAPLLKKITAIATKLMELFNFEDMGKRLGKVLDEKLFSDIGAKGKQVWATWTEGMDMTKTITAFDVIVGMALYLVAALESLPEIFSALSVFSGRMFENIRAKLEEIYPALQGMVQMLLGVLQIGLIAIGAGITLILAGLVLAFPLLVGPLLIALKVTADVVGAAVGTISKLKKSLDFGKNPFAATGKGIAGLIPEMAPVMGNIQGRHKDLMGQYQAGKDKATEDKKDKETKNSIMNTQTGYLYQIAENTNKIEDLKAYALGGGDLARIGITPQGMYGRGRADITVNGSALARAMEEMIQDSVHQLSAQGAM